MRRHNYTLLLGLTIAVAALLLVLAPLPVNGQSRPLPPPPPPPERSPDKDDLGSDIGSHESEMRARLLLKAEKKQYEENLGRAREAAQIATELRDAYQAKKSF